MLAKNRKMSDKKTEIPEKNKKHITDNFELLEILVIVYGFYV